MHLEYSEHWIKKKRFRVDITEDILEYATIHFDTVRDLRWEDCINAIGKIPWTGREIKVVYKREGNKIKIVTAYWLT